jgi:hypothetical protein
MLDKTKWIPRNVLLTPTQVEQIAILVTKRRRSTGCAASTHAWLREAVEEKLVRETGRK